MKVGYSVKKNERGLVIPMEKITKLRGFYLFLGLAGGSFRILPVAAAEIEWT